MNLVPEIRMQVGSNIATGYTTGLPLAVTDLSVLFLIGQDQARIRCKLDIPRSLPDILRPLMISQRGPLCHPTLPPKPETVLYHVYDRQYIYTTVDREATVNIIYIRPSILMVVLR